MMIDLNVQLIDFKTSAVDELVRHNEDDSYTILLNSRQAPNRLERAYRHAVRHISNGDFEDRDRSVQEIEALTHEGDDL